MTGFLKTIYRAHGGKIDLLVGANINPGRVLSSRARDELIGASRNGDTIILTRTNNGIIREAMEFCTQLQAAGVHKKIAHFKGPKLDKSFEIIKSLVQLCLHLNSSSKVCGRTFNHFDEVKE